MKLEITLTRQDLSKNFDKSISDIDMTDFPCLTKELWERASQIMFIDDDNCLDGGVRQIRLLKDRGIYEASKLDEILEVIDRHGNDKDSKLDKVTLVTCRSIVKSVRGDYF